MIAMEFYITIHGAQRTSPDDWWSPGLISSTISSLTFVGQKDVSNTVVPCNLGQSLIFELW